MNWHSLAENVLNGHELTHQECIDFLHADSKETLDK